MEAGRSEKELGGGRMELGSSIMEVGSGRMELGVVDRGGPRRDGARRQRDGCKGSLRAAVRG